MTRCDDVPRRVKERFLSHFMVDRHQKIVKQGEIKLDSLVPSFHDNNVSHSGDENLLSTMWNYNEISWNNV
jgi:predicted ATP-dependent Lon-type protease